MVTSGASEIRPGRRIKYIVSFSCVLFAGAVFLAGCGTQSSDRENQWPSESFAYLAHVSPSADELVVMRGNRTIARKQGRLGSRDGLATEVLWTFDGRYAITRSFQKDKDGIDAPHELIVVDAQNGSVRALPCTDCTSMAPIGESKLLVSLQSQGRSAPELRQFDLSTSEPPTRYTTSLPPFDTSVNLLASIPGYALVSGSNVLDVDSAERLFLVDSRGSATTVGNTGKNAAGHSVAATAQTAEGKPMFAIHTQEYVAAEGQASGLFLFDPVSGARTDTDVTNVTAPAKLDLRNGEDLIYYANDLFWGKDGHLYATWIVATDDGKWGAAPNAAAPSQLWRLDGTQWIQVSPKSVLTVRQLNDSAWLTVYSDADEVPGGTLYLEQNQQQTHIANNVTTIAVPG